MSQSFGRYLRLHQEYYCTVYCTVQCPVSIEISCSSVTNVKLTSVFAGFVSRASHLRQMYTQVKQLIVTQQFCYTWKVKIFPTKLELPCSETPVHGISPCSQEEVDEHIVLLRRYAVQARHCDYLFVKNGTRYLCLLPNVGVSQRHLPVNLPTFLEI